MGRYRESVCRICRREKQKLFLKGDRCYTIKCAFERRKVGDYERVGIKGSVKMPGQHGAMPKKYSDYGIQLREKQKIRKSYGIYERQFQNYFYDAVKKKGITGKNLLRLLELRLDNIIYVMGLARSRAQARQFVLHGHIIVNNKKVNVPSYSVKAGDVIGIKEKSKTSPIFSLIKESAPLFENPRWLQLDKDNFSGKILSFPEDQDLQFNFMEQLVVEHYSRK